MVDFEITRRENENDSELAKRMLCKLTIENRTRENKPTIIFLWGDSGEGKSYDALWLLDALYSFQGIDIVPRLDYVEIFTPFEYARKMKRILETNKKAPDYELTKDLNVIVLDEARELVSANEWMTFINKTISSVNALSRGVKPLVFIVVSQFIADIDKKVRFTINLYGACARPLRGYGKLTLYRIYKDDRDLDNPKIRKARIKGYIRELDGSRSLTIPQFYFKLPRKELRDQYEEMQFNAKAPILHRKLEELMRFLEAKYKREFEKVDGLVEYYSNHSEELRNLLEERKGKTRVKKEFIKLFDLAPEETRQFESRLEKKLAEKNLKELSLDATIR